LQLDGDIDFSDSLDGAKFERLDLRQSEVEDVVEPVKKKTSYSESSSFELFCDKLGNLLNGLGKAKSIRDNLKELVSSDSVWISDCSLQKILDDAEQRYNRR
jgi:hypothetical protein